MFYNIMRMCDELAGRPER